MVSKKNFEKAKYFKIMKSLYRQKIEIFMKRIQEYDKVQKEQKEVELKETRRKEEYKNYITLRAEIEKMPQYKIWRQAVLEKFGRKCAVCGSKNNLEVDHRYKSFYAIIKEDNIINTIQAYECATLWNINNGAPLCKIHHNKTFSSIYRQLKSF